MNRNGYYHELERQLNVLSKITRFHTRMSTREGRIDHFQTADDEEINNISIGTKHCLDQRVPLRNEDIVAFNTHKDIFESISDLSLTVSRRREIILQNEQIMPHMIIPLMTNVVHIVLDKIKELCRHLGYLENL